MFILMPVTLVLWRTEARGSLWRCGREPSCRFNESLAPTPPQGKEEKGQAGMFLAHTQARCCKSSGWWEYGNTGSPQQAAHFLPYLLFYISQNHNWSPRDLLIDLSNVWKPNPSTWRAPRSNHPFSKEPGTGLQDGSVGKALATKHDDHSSIPRTHMVQREK